MKKYLFYLLGLILVLSACKKIEDAPTDTVDERLDAKMSAYQKQLESSKFGWKAYLLTGSDLPLVYVFKFNDKNRALMSAEYAQEFLESSYRLKALQLPTLIFDTYSSLHLVADPDPGVVGGYPGAGFLSDFEFGITSSSPDTIKLVGLTNKSKLILIKATSEATISKIFAEKEAFESSFTRLKTYFKQTTINNVTYEVNVDPLARSFTLSYLEGTELKTASSEYYVSGTTIYFFKPLLIKGASIASLSGVNFNETTGLISAQLNGMAIEIKEAAAPMFYNKAIAPDFFSANLFKIGWKSYDGFTVDGVVDAFGLKSSIPDFIILNFYTYSIIKGNIAFSGNTANFSYAMKVDPVISNDGILINTLNYMVGSTTNQAAKTSIDKTAQALTDPKGFYVIRVGNGYDLVAVKDARSWIKFE